jgi:hypothetical protein
MEDLSYQLLLLLGNAAIGLLAVGLAYLTKWLATKVKNDRAKGIIMRADDLAIRVVRDVYQGFVSAKKGTAAWTSAEKKAAKDRALAKLRSYLGTKGAGEIGWLLGGQGKPLEDFLSSAVENAVVHSKNVGRIASGNGSSA